MNRGLWHIAHPLRGGDRVGLEWGQTMIRRIRRLGWTLSILAAGCATGPLHENPTLLRPDFSAEGCENPVLVAPGEPGPSAYADVFERVLSVVGDNFRIAYMNRYDGRIITHPITAAGIVQFWKPGSPETRERLLVTAQSYRYRAEVLIEAAPQGGYLVHVVVYKELEDVAVPIGPNQNAAAFQGYSTVERQFEVVTPESPTRAWIPKGREMGLEQAILNQIRACQQ